MPDVNPGPALNLFLLVWVGWVFLMGVSVGSFLNLCICRVPLQKSIVWPSSRCPVCYQPIRWYDNLPIIGYLRLRGRCRDCQVPFSARYLAVEVLTGLGFAGLFYADVILNVNHFAPLHDKRYLLDFGVVPWEGWVIFAHHAVLFSFLATIAWCDIDSREIPTSVTFTGAVVGLLFAALLPWPWPNDPAEAVRRLPLNATSWAVAEQFAPLPGSYPWPFWGPLPAGFAPGGNWQTGLTTGVVGILVGSMFLRTISFVFSVALGREALGLGDADLMMMAGAFLGWQPVVVAFFLGVFLALPLGMFQLIVFRDGSLPFGPSLALGVMITALAWNSIGPPFLTLFFSQAILSIVCACGLMLMALFASCFRLVRREEPS